MNHLQWLFLFHCVTFTPHPLQSGVYPHHFTEIAFTRFTNSPWWLYSVDTSQLLHYFIFHYFLLPFPPWVPWLQPQNFLVIFLATLLQWLSSSSCFCPLNVGICQDSAMDPLPHLRTLGGFIHMCLSAHVYQVCLQTRSPSWASDLLSAPQFNWDFPN